MYSDKLKQYHKEYYLKNKEKLIKYRKDNKEHISLYHKEYNKKNKNKGKYSETNKETIKKWQINNKERIKSISHKSYVKNKEIHGKRCSEWKKNNPEKSKFINKKAYIKRRYNISYEFYEKMLESQSNKCKICGKDFLKTRKGNSPFIDHCHKTNKVRGILCHSCNIALGNFNDSIEIMEKAIEYLKQNY